MLLKTRIIQHKSSKNHTLISKAFQKYNDFDIEVLIDTDNSLLDEYELKFIEEYNTIYPHGYNLRSGGQNGYHFCKETRLKCSESQRKNDKHLPMYMYKTENGYRCRPPGRNEKYFNYTHLDENTNFLLAKEYIEGHTILYDKYIKPNLLPKFISKINRGNRSGYRCTLPGYEKHFTSKKFTDEEKLMMTINYLKSIQEDGSTTKC